MKTLGQVLLVLAGLMALVQLAGESNWTHVSRGGGAVHRVLLRGR